MKLTDLLESKLNNVTFTKPELVKVFKDFLDRLVDDYGNNRKDMIEYHNVRY